MKIQRKNKTLVFITVITLLAGSCQKVFIGSSINNTPVNNFDEMWKGYHSWYGTFRVRNINWDSLHKIYRPLVNNNMTEPQLYKVLCDLITPLNDIHAFIQPTSAQLQRYESSTFFRNNKVQRDFSIDLVKTKYFPTITTVDTNLHYGISSNNIGYIHFGSFDLPLAYYQKQMNMIMGGMKNTKGMIIDIRNHGGGDDRVGRYVAGWFATQKKLFMTVRKRNGPGYDDFSNPEQWYVDPSGNFQYTNPVVLLTTKWTASAAETFTWAMNTLPNVTQVGDTTAGGFTDVISRELPNGWLYFVGVGDFRDADGKSEEGIGIAPGLYIVNTPADIIFGNDFVLEAAIKKLK